MWKYHSSVRLNGLTPRVMELGFAYLSSQPVWHLAQPVMEELVQDIHESSSAAVLVAGLAAFRRGKPAGTDTKSSWRQTILKGAGLISTFWLAFRSQRRDRDGI